VRIESRHPPLIAKYSKWKCEITTGVYYRPYEDKEPSWWTRLVYRVLLGLKWTKDE
jgi:hypothetical protein